MVLSELQVVIYLGDKGKGDSPVPHERQQGNERSEIYEAALPHYYSKFPD